MAKKSNQHPEQIDLTTFAWVNAGSDESTGKPGCGGCHPGGGGMEFDRDGLRYDTRMQAQPELADTLDGDYYRSQWDRTGVLEADCFICHLPGYFFRERLRQLKRLNFQWAAVAASGIGLVEGSVRAGDAPRVVYNKRWFNDDGRIVIDLESDPRPENCVFCHGKADLIKRGFSWDDRDNHDVHNFHGFGCTHCHPGDLAHNFAKGDENLSTVRDDLDNTMLACRECHTQGYMGAPSPGHRRIRPNHLEKMACEVCHIPVLGRAASAGLDVTTGKVINYPVPGARHIGSRVDWRPGFMRDEDGQLRSVNYFVSNLYTNRDTDGRFYPLFVREVGTAYETVQGRLTVRAEEGPLIQSDADIELMLVALERSLEGNPRFTEIRPYYHMGGGRYSLADDRTLCREPDDSWVARSDAFNVSHNVAPTQMALGASGCSDCHSDGAHIFEQWIADRRPDFSGVAPAPLALFDSRPWVYYLNQLHEHNALKFYYGPIFLLVIFCLVVYHHHRHSANVRFPAGQPERRRSWPVRHLLSLIRGAGFVALVVTGYIFFFNRMRLLEALFSDNRSAVAFHWWTGLVFLAATIVSAVLRHREAAAGRGDSAGIRETRSRLIFYRLSLWSTLIMGATGAAMVLRERFSPELKYLISIVHALFAFIIVAVGVSRLYLSLSSKVLVLRALEGRSGSKTVIRQIRQAIQLLPD